MTVRKNLISKIKKLLEVTKEHGATEAEAIQAALMAQKLIADNDVSKAELYDTTIEEIIEYDAGIYRLQWRYWLATAIAENFRCREYYHSDYGERDYRVMFVGYESDAKAAAIVFESLYRLGNKLANKQVKNMRYSVMMYYSPRDIKYSFLKGYVEGIRSELEKQSQALMIVTPLAVKDYYADISQGFNADLQMNGYYLNNEIKDNGYTAGRDAVRAGRMNQSQNTYALT